MPDEYKDRPLGKELEAFFIEKTQERDLSNPEEDVWAEGFSKDFRMGAKYTLIDYWSAGTCGSILFYEWKDKPHRLLYDLVGEVAHLRAEIKKLRGE